MGKDRIRIATKEDAPAYLALIQESFQEVKDLGIDWPSTNATLESVTENIETGIALVLERDGQLISTIRFVNPGKMTALFHTILSCGGLRLLTNLRDKGLERNS
ncbi:hypothetical protein [Aerococcus viridans]|uniref:hypothetical protein n=1 Tax=Aerococcus viridans TaxID=1377 RepID=UPI003B21F8DB